MILTSPSRLFRKPEGAVETLALQLDTSNNPHGIPFDFQQPNLKSIPAIYPHLQPASKTQGRKTVELLMSAVYWEEIPYGSVRELGAEWRFRRLSREIYFGAQTFDGKVIQVYEFRSCHVIHSE